MTDPQVNGSDAPETPRPPQDETREKENDLALDLAEEWISPEPTVL